MVQILCKSLNMIRSSQNVTVNLGTYEQRGVTANG